MRYLINTSKIKTIKKQIKMEKNKELLKPRFEVIADYPYPKNHCYYKVGEIINTITEEDISYCRKYPHLFRELK